MSLPPEIEEICQKFVYITLFQSVLTDLKELVDTSHPPPLDQYYTAWLRRYKYSWARPPAKISNDPTVTLCHPQDWGLWMHGYCRDYVGFTQNVVLTNRSWLDLWFRNACYDVDARPLYTKEVEVEVYELLI